MLTLFLVVVLVVAIGWAIYARGLLLLPAILITLWWACPTADLNLPVPFISLTDCILFAAVALAAIFAPAKIAALPKDRFIGRLIRLGVAFAACGAVGLALWSGDPARGNEYYRHTSIYPLLYLIVFGVALNGPRDVRVVLRLLGWSSAVFATLLLLNYAWGTWESGSVINTQGGLRLGGQPLWPVVSHVQYDPVSLGVSLSVVLPMLFSQILLTANRQTRTWFDRGGIIAVLLVLMVLFQTGTRSAWIAAIVGGGVVFWLARRRPPLVIVPLIILLTLVHGWLGKDITIASDTRAQSLLNVIDDENVQERFYLSKRGAEILAGNPLGIGYGRESREIMNEHNLFVFVGLGSGVLGLGIFCWCGWLLWRKLYQCWRRGSVETRIICAGGLGALVAALVNGVSDTVLMETFQANALFGCIGIAVAAALSDGCSWVSNGPPLVGVEQQQAEAAIAGES